jgi:hypothetical protein
VLLLQVPANVRHHPILDEFERRCDGYITANGVAIEYGGEQSR